MVGTALALFFIMAMFRGAIFDERLDNDALDFDTFPGKSFYSAGMWMEHTPVFKIPNAVEEFLVKDTEKYYEEMFGVYYAHIIWSQVLSYALLLLSITFLLAGIVSDGNRVYILLGGIALCVIVCYYFVTRIHVRMNDRRTECEAEFPNAISKLALIVNSGMTINEAWRFVAEGRTGVFYDLMKNAADAMKNGIPPTEAIYQFGVKCDSDEIRKFTTAMNVSIEEGPKELKAFLVTETTELWEAKRQNLLQKGETAASALLAPITVMFLGIIIIIIAAAMQSFSF